MPIIGNGDVDIEYSEEEKQRLAELRKWESAGYRLGYAAGVSATFNPQLQWISCSERMPPTYGRYLVCVPYTVLGGSVKTSSWFQKPWIGISSFVNGEFYDKDASHWMNLPSAAE